MRLIEVLLGAGLFAGLSAVLIGFDTFDTLYALTRSSEHWELDEIVLITIAAMFGLLVAALATMSRQTRELRAAAETVRRARDEANLGNQAKSRFLASMSHEFRTPLNAVLGFSDILRADEDHPLSPMQRQYVDHVHDAGQRLLRLVDELLHLSRIDEISSAPILENVALEPLLDECLQAAREVAADARVHLELAVPAGIVARADRSRLRHVVGKLIANAVTYNVPDGRVRVEAGRAADGMTTIAVTDTGRGIPEALIRDLFQPFNRLGLEGGTIAGAGIGLAICKRLVGAMDGSIDVSSREGHGSTFLVRLPAGTSGIG